MSALRTNVWFGGKLISENSNAVFPDRVGTNRASGARFHPYGDEITSTANDREKFATYTKDSIPGSTTWISDTMQVRTGDSTHLIRTEEARSRRNLAAGTDLPMSAEIRSICATDVAWKNKTAGWTMRKTAR